MTNVWHLSDAGSWVASNIPNDSRYVVIDRLRSRLAPRFTPRKRLVPLAEQSAAQSRVLLVRTGHAGAEQWFVIPYPGAQLRRNGRMVTAGLSVLSDRDIVSLDPSGNQVWTFTTERLAQVEVFAGGAGLHCPRCKLELQQGQQVVACPSCNALHHQDAALGKPCWTYAPTCAQCDRATSLSNPTYSWIPDEL